MQVARTRRGLPTVSTKRKTMNENMDEDETRLVRQGNEDGPSRGPQTPVDATAERYAQTINGVRKILGIRS